MRIIFMGTPQFALNSLQLLLEKGEKVVAVVTQPDRPRGRGRVITPSPIKAFAHDKGLLVYQPKDLRSSTAFARLAALEPDLIVVVAYGRILPREILGLPAKGCINLHASLLPRYRGAAPIQWALLEGERMTGVTTMYVSEALDEGDIIMQSEVPILSMDTFGSLHDKLAHIGAKLLLNTIARIRSGTALRIPQPQKGVSFAPPLKRCHEILDWSRKARDLWFQVRALSPRPGATTYWQNSILKVWEVFPGEERDLKGKWGEVVAVDKQDGIFVKTGGGLLHLKELQPAGKQKMSASDFARGYGIEPGAIFGK